MMPQSWCANYAAPVQPKSAQGRARVKTQTGFIAANYSYNFIPLHRDFRGLTRVARHKSALSEGPSAFSHRLGQTVKFQELNERQF